MSSTAVTRAERNGRTAAARARAGSRRDGPDGLLGRHVGRARRWPLRCSCTWAGRADDDDSQPRPGPAGPGRRSAGACPRRTTAPSWSTAPSVSAATPRPSSSACPTARVIGIDRDTAALELAGERLRRFGDRFVGVHAVYDEIAEVVARPGARPRRRGPLRPRRLLDAARRPRARFRVRRGRAARHADGRHHRTHRGRRPQHLLRRRADARPAGLRRGEVRQEDRLRGRARARGRALHHQRPPRRAALRRDPGAGAAHRGTPGQAHVPGAADGGQRRAGRAAPRDAGRDRRDRGRRPRGRRVLPLARGPPGQARLHRGHPPRRARGPAVRARGQRAAPSARHPRRRGRRRARDRSRTRAPPRCGCAPSNDPPLLPQPARGARR